MDMLDCANRLLARTEAAMDRPRTGTLDGDTVARVIAEPPPTKEEAYQEAIETTKQALNALADVRYALHTLARYMDSDAQLRCVGCRLNAMDSLNTLLGVLEREATVLADGRRQP